MIDPPSIQWFPGHMAKTRRIMKESIKYVDVVVELLDARIPISSSNPEFEVLTERKPKIVLLNKADLADSNTNVAWIEYYKKNGVPAIATDSQSGKGLNKLPDAINVVAKEILEKREQKGISGSATRLMIVGIPNVGKSSLINRLSHSKKTQVADKPGVTRRQQWVKTDTGLEILDTPGVLWPKFEDPKVGQNLAFTGAIKDDIIDTETLSMLLLEVLAEKYPNTIYDRYKIKSEDGIDGYDMLEMLGKNRGMLLPGGKINMDRAAMTLLDEFRAGVLGRISLEAPKDIESM